MHANLTGYISLLLLDTSFHGDENPGDMEVDPKANRCLFVGNIPKGVSVFELRDAFLPFGTILVSMSVLPLYVRILMIIYYVSSTCILIHLTVLCYIRTYILFIYVCTYIRMHVRSCGLLDNHRCSHICTYVHLCVCRMHR